ncbi:DUF494 domain-containing protein [uncultured Abyssibacter sp.]|uniref:DUF494 family protein n=1 Tax=uncultured Abyssibacter sp. TaxID=2320202 RepID=UPI0032B22161
MKENVLDVLLYLFENYLEEEIEARYDGSPLREELEAAGFPDEAISHAFDWLEGLESRKRSSDTVTSTTASRVYAAEEIARLSTGCRGLLMHLENLGILHPDGRELVIERLMALDDDAVEEEHVKWVVLMVLFNQPEHEEAYARMEDLVFQGYAEALH